MPYENDTNDDSLKRIKGVPQAVNEYMICSGLYYAKNPKHYKYTRRQGHYRTYERKYLVLGG